MLFSGISVFYCLLAVILYQCARLFLRKRHNIREAGRRGCLSPPSSSNRGLWGIKSLRESIEATKDGWGPVWMHQTLNAIGKNVHTIRAPVFDYELLITRDTENAKAIFSNQSGDFDIGPHRERTFKSVLGLGVMTGRGLSWKHSRELIRPQFARDNVANLAMFEKHVQSLIKRLRIDAEEWTAKIELQSLFQNLTLDISTEFLYGQSVFAQDPEERSKLPLSRDPHAPDVANFGHHLDEVKRILDRQGALAKYSWLVRDRAFSEHRKALHKFVDYFVQKTLSETSEQSRLETPANMQGNFVLLAELKRETRDPIKLRNETLNVLHASRDTTAALLGWIFYFFARREDVFNRVRDEVMQKLACRAPHQITFTDLWTLPYLQFVVNETIRFVGIVPMNERAAIRDTALPRGGGLDGKSPVFVPKGRQILIPTYSMQHREDIWGPDAEEYKPERWQERKAGWEFIPFGGGARQCIGRKLSPVFRVNSSANTGAEQFARTEAMYVVARLLQTFDKIENMEAPGTPMLFHHTIENRPGGSGVPIRLRFASSTSAVEKSALQTWSLRRRSQIHHDSEIDG